MTAHDQLREHVELVAANPSTHPAYLAWMTALRDEHALALQSVESWSASALAMHETLSEVLNACVPVLFGSVDPPDWDAAQAVVKRACERFGGRG